MERAASRTGLALLVAGLVLGVSARAHAICNPTTCEARSIATDCHTETWDCVDEGTQSLMSMQGGAPELGNIILCDIIFESFAAPGTACETDNNICTTDVCGATGSPPTGDGICHHNSIGTTPCGNICLASGCCTSPNSCGGGATCPANGGTCSCPAGQKSCNGTCIPTASCCTDSDCPSDEANHRHGVCGAQGCAYACDTGYVACGSTCIPSTQCCSSADCKTPPSACYEATGTCASGVCSYAYANGAACNADSDACTPNDSCMSGTCVADTAHLVTCVQRACHSAPACDPATGNCEDTVITGSCGGTPCLPAGTCSVGVCSTAGQEKDCSAMSTACKVGVCDPSLPASADCTTSNVLNGTACTLTDKCQLQTACSGGDCVGTPVVCTPSGTCRVSMCNGTTGDCDETVAPQGTACNIEGACLQNPTCDATGNCNGDAVPDGTPCVAAPGCDTSAACVTGACTCLVAPSFMPGDDGGAADAPGDGGGVGANKKGCSAAPGSPAEPGAVFMLGLFGLLALRRRA